MATTMMLISLCSLVMASVHEKNTDLNANGAFSDLITVKISYFRSLCGAHPLQWDQALADKAKQSIQSCDLEYDYWSTEGQIIFRMLGDHNQIVNSPNATAFALQHWYDMRENYTDIQSDEYDQFQPFYGAWEFTQMVWKANTKIGCAYFADVVCPDIDVTPNDNMYQLYCLLTPGGNKWDQWGANVDCKDCTGVEPQTSTINTATFTFTSENKRAVIPTAVYEPPNEYVKTSLIEAMARVEEYMTMNNDEFRSRWDLVGATTVSTASAVSFKR